MRPRCRPCLSRRRQRKRPRKQRPQPPAWCETVNEPDRIVGNGAGGRDSGPAVIQAFEHAYYVKRSGDAVASLMVMPSP